MTVTVDAVIFFEIIDAEQALCAVDDYRYKLHLYRPWKSYHSALDES